VRSRIAVLAVALFALPSLGLVSGVFAQADVNGDGVVNVLDMSLVGSCIGQDPEASVACENGDTDGNGVIDVDDLHFVNDLFDVEAVAGANPPEQPAFIWHERDVSTSSLPATTANPFRGALTPLTYTAAGRGNRRYYSRSTDLMNLGNSEAETRLKELLWNDPLAADPTVAGYTDLVDPFPEELNDFWDRDCQPGEVGCYNTAPKDFRIPSNQANSNVNQIFGGDYSGMAPCVNDTLGRHPEE
jgi:hypothetical protein